MAELNKKFDGAAMEGMKPVLKKKGAIGKITLPEERVVPVAPVKELTEEQKAAVTAANELLDAFLSGKAAGEYVINSIKEAIDEAIERFNIPKEKRELSDVVAEHNLISEKLLNQLKEKQEAGLTDKQYEHSLGVCKAFYKLVEDNLDEIRRAIKGTSSLVVTNKEALSAIREFDLSKTHPVAGTLALTYDEHRKAGKAFNKKRSALLFNPDNEAFAEPLKNEFEWVKNSQGGESIDKESEVNKARFEAVETIFRRGASEEAGDGDYRDTGIWGIYTHYLGTKPLSPEAFYGVPGHAGVWSMMDWAQEPDAPIISEYIRMMFPAEALAAAKEVFLGIRRHDVFAAKLSGSKDTADVTQADRERWLFEHNGHDLADDIGFTPVFKRDANGVSTSEVDHWEQSKGILKNGGVSFRAWNALKAAYINLMTKAEMEPDPIFLDPHEDPTDSDIKAAVKAYLVELKAGHLPKFYARFEYADGHYVSVDKKALTPFVAFAVLTAFLDGVVEEPIKWIEASLDLEADEEFGKYVEFVNGASSPEAQEEQEDRKAQIEGLARYCDERKKVVALRAAFWPLALTCEDEPFTVDGKRYASIDAYKASLEAPNEAEALRYAVGGDLALFKDRMAARSDAKFVATRCEVALPSAIKAVVKATVAKAAQVHSFAGLIAATEGLSFDWLEAGQESHLQYARVLEGLRCVINSGFWNTKPVVKLGGESWSYDQIAELSGYGKRTGTSVLPTADGDVPTVSESDETAEATVAAEEKAAEVSSKLFGYCPNCGTKVEKMQRFCHSCGQKLQ